MLAIKAPMSFFDGAVGQTNLVVTTIALLLAWDAKRLVGPPGSPRRDSTNGRSAYHGATPLVRFQACVPLALKEKHEATVAPPPTGTLSTRPLRWARMGSDPCRRSPVALNTPARNDASGPLISRELGEIRAIFSCRAATASANLAQAGELAAGLREAHTPSPSNCEGYGWQHLLEGEAARRRIAPRRSILFALVEDSARGRRRRADREWPARASGAQNAVTSALSGRSAMMRRSRLYAYAAYCTEPVKWRSRAASHLVRETPYAGAALLNVLCPTQKAGLQGEVEAATTVVAETIFD